MSSKTLALSAHAGGTTGAVIESSIGSLRVTDVFEVTGAAGAPLPGGPFDRVVATLEPSAAAFRILELPFRDRRRVSQAVGPALEEHVPYSLDDGTLAWDYAAPASAAGATVLAAISGTSRLEAARAHLDDLGAGSAPQRLLWEPSAVLTAYRRAVGESETFVAVDLGDGGATVARVDGGGLAALRVVAPCDDALMLRNLAWSLATVAGDATRAVVGGRHGARLLDDLARRVPAMQFERLPAAAPTTGFEARDWRDHTGLVGLVIAASGESLAPTLDFEAGAGALFGIANLGDLRSEMRPLLRWTAVAAALAALAIGIDYVQLFRERSVLAGRAEQVYASAMPSGSGGAGRKLKMEMRLRELTGRAAIGGPGAAGSPLELLASLSREIPKSLDVVVDQVEHSPPAAKVTGHAGSFETVTKMQQELQRSGTFARVEVRDVHAAVTGGGVEFLLELTTEPVPGAGA